MWRYIHTNGQTYGPADLDHLLVWLQEGRFGADDWIWIVEEERWVQAKEEPALAEVLRRKVGSGLYQSILLGGTAGPAPAPASSPAPVSRAIAIPDNLFEHEKRGGRHYLRFETVREGRYCAVGSQRQPTEKDYRPCRLINVSIGGVGIEAPESLELGRVVRLEFKLVPADDESFRVQGRVVRTVPSLTPGFVEHGLQFLTLPESDKKRLILFLENELGEGGST